MGTNLRITFIGHGSKDPPGVGDLLFVEPTTLRLEIIRFAHATGGKLFIVREIDVTEALDLGSRYGVSLRLFAFVSLFLGEKATDLLLRAIGHGFDGAFGVSNLFLISGALDATHIGMRALPANEVSCKHDPNESQCRRQETKRATAFVPAQKFCP
jgi:hypothetical protein